MAGIWGAVRAGSDPFCPWTHLPTGPPYAAWKPSPLQCYVPTTLPYYWVWLLSNKPLPSAQSLVLVHTGPLEWSLPRTNGPHAQAMGTGAFLDSDAARPGPLDLSPQDSLDTSPSTDFSCYHSPLRARGLVLHKLLWLLSLKLWLTRNTQAWPRLGSQIAHIEHIVKWVNLSKGAGCFGDHVSGCLENWRGYLHEGSCLYSRIQYYCLPSFLFRVTNTQAHEGVIVIYWTEVAYTSSLRNTTNSRPVEQWLRSYLLLLTKYSWSLVIWPYLNTPRQSCFKTSSFISSQRVYLYRFYHGY